jgi:isopentenyl-diphosphate Delta-isomerase
MPGQGDSHPRDDAGQDSKVILVDGDDREVGTEERMRAHREGLRHRAFSIFVFDRAGRLLLQRRAAGKYHSGGLWSNTCCSHPLPGESVLSAAHRRLREEMGFDCPLQPSFTFVYKAALDGGVIEHEVDHVLIGEFDGEPSPDPEEVHGWRWQSFDDVVVDVRGRPEQYTVWFKQALERAPEHFRSRSDREPADLTRS